MLQTDIVIAKETSVSIDQVEVLSVRNSSVLLSSDLAKLYGVEHKVLMQAVKRHAGRFPDDFMFQLTSEEYRNLKSHFVTSSWGGTRKLPYAFTEQGVAMLSSVLNSERAVQVNIHIMRLFVKMRHEAAKYDDLAQRLADMEKTLGSHSEEFQAIYAALQQLMHDESSSNRRIGFRQVRERKKKYAVR